MHNHTAAQSVPRLVGVQVKGRLQNSTQQDRPDELQLQPVEFRNNNM